MDQKRRKSTMIKLNINISDTRWWRFSIQILVVLSSLNVVLCSHSAVFSAPLNLSESDEGFKPIIPPRFDPEYIARNIFTKAGQYRIFSPDNSDLRNNRHWMQKRTDTEGIITRTSTMTTTKAPETMKTEKNTEKLAIRETRVMVEREAESDSLDTALRTELKGLEDLLSDYLSELFGRKKVGKNGISVEIDETLATENGQEAERNENRLKRSLKRFARAAVVSVSLPRTMESGRLFFFSGLKKILWPIFVGIQVIKSILFALFLPSIIGSLGKIATQGSASVAGFNRPSETVNDLNFNNDFADDSKFATMNGGYDYHQSEASTNHFSTQLYDAATNNNNVLSRYGMTDQRDNLMNALGHTAYKNSNKHHEESLGDGYKVFKKLPVSSLLLSNYDPFYSPLLSRLDAIFQQLGLDNKSETCREKLICLMYANPGKYSPYSNLVSAQLSRDLDELRKPTSENPEILRFFKYMRAAKDGQDGIKCEEQYSTCTEFEDFKEPVMLTNYHNINKLVEARKLL